MPIKNYTTKVPVNRSVQEIQDCLVKHGATGIQLRYEQGTGKIEALNFLLPFNDQEVPFSLPVEWKKFQSVLKEQRVSRWKDDDFCYRVAWRNIRDWIFAQMALYETKMVKVEQIFLPYMSDMQGNTLFQKIKENPQLLLN